MAGSRLFKPLKIGTIEVKHRIVMPALSRMRATKDHIPTDLMLEYYTQRAAVPGTLIITEANILSAEHSGYTHAPGIWKPEQINAWRKITDAVHTKGSFMFLQVMAMGRAADPDESEKEGFTIVGASAIPLHEGATVPQIMTIEDIKSLIGQFGQAAKNAVAAGFDGIELLAANGMLVEQFIHDSTNHREDDYGGSIEKRSRLTLEILQTMADAIGAERVAVRFSPFSKYANQGMKEPIAQYSDIIRKVNGLKLAYLHLIESRVKGSEDVTGFDKLDFAYRLFDGPILINGGYTTVLARKHVDEAFPEKDIGVSFGRSFIANPDLVFRIKEGVVLNGYDRDSFYTLENPKGYIDYPYSKEYLSSLNLGTTQ